MSSTSPSSSNSLTWSSDGTTDNVWLVTEVLEPLREGERVVDLPLDLWFCDDAAAAYLTYFIGLLTNIILFIFT
jgi:hypothetical protein